MVAHSFLNKVERVIILINLLAHLNFIETEKIQSEKWARLYKNKTLQGFQDVLKYENSVRSIESGINNYMDQ